jgi:5-methylcytosine-specific restriction endonuclease McrA
MPIYISGACANCDSLSVTIKGPLFCSEGCRQAAELVRYVRACRRDGRALIPDVKEAIRMRMAMVLAGGYPEKERQVPPAIRAAIFQRAGGRCENCGCSFDLDRSTGNADASPTIQHVRGNSSDPTNLKAFCRRCNLRDAQARFVPVAPDSSEARMAADLMMRWTAPEPRRLCDDDQRWSVIWRELSRCARDVITTREGGNSASKRI